MGRSTPTGSYETLLIVLAGSTLGAAALMQLLPRYRIVTRPRSHRDTEITEKFILESETSVASVPLRLRT